MKKSVAIILSILIATISIALLSSGCQVKTETERKTEQRDTQPVGETKVLGEKIKKKVKVYFANPEKQDKAAMQSDPETAAGQQMAFPLERAIDTTTTTIKEDTISALLKDVNGKEKKDGYINEIHNISLDSLSVKDGIATVKFSGKDFLLEGDMSGPRVRAQIEKTLQQFSDVDTVDIYINDDAKFDDLRG